MPWTEIVALIAMRRGGVKWVLQWIERHFLDHTEAINMVASVVEALVRLGEEQRAKTLYIASGYWSDDDLLQFLIAAGRCPRGEL